MAKHLAYIFATEQDRVNCPFYFKTGACRHGDRCSRYHNKPTVSPTLLLANMYQRPDMAVPGAGAGAAPAAPMDPRKAQEHFEDFYEDLYAELSKFGDIESLIVCDNLSDHMVGNVYVQFREEDHAVAALTNLTGRFYSGRPIIPEFSPVTDLREATCRDNTCMRGGLCNFMHLKKISKELRRQLFDRYGRKRSRSRSPVGRRGHDDRQERGRYHGGRGRRERSPGPGGRRNRSPVRESSAERRAKIEQWNREREQGGDGRKNEHGNHSGSGYSQSGGEYRGNGQPRQTRAEYDY